MTKDRETLSGAGSEPANGLDIHGEIYSRSWETPKGTEYTTIRLRIRSDGAMRLSGQDMGPSVEETWNHDDYEYFLEIPASSANRLLFLVMKEAFNSSEKMTFERVHHLCQDAGVEAEFFTWP